MGASPLLVGHKLNSPKIKVGKEFIGLKRVFPKKGQLKKEPGRGTHWFLLKTNQVFQAFGYQTWKGWERFWNPQKGITNFHWLNQEFGANLEFLP